MGIASIASQQLVRCPVSDVHGKALRKWQISQNVDMEVPKKKETNQNSSKKSEETEEERIREEKTTARHKVCALKTWSHPRQYFRFSGTAGSWLQSSTGSGACAMDGAATRFNGAPAWRGTCAKKFSNFCHSSRRLMRSWQGPPSPLSRDRRALQNLHLENGRSSVEHVMRDTSKISKRLKVNCVGCDGYVLRILVSPGLVAGRYSSSEQPKAPQVVAPAHAGPYLSRPSLQLGVDRVQGALWCLPANDQQVSP